MAKQLSLEQVVTCGVEKNIAAAMLPQVNQWLSSLPTFECWQRFTREILKPDRPFPLHELLYETTFWDEGKTFDLISATECPRDL